MTESRSAASASELPTTLGSPRYVSENVVIVGEKPARRGRRGFEPMLRTCAHCRLPFWATERGQSYCDKRCQKRHKEQNRRRRIENELRG